MIQLRASRNDRVTVREDALPWLSKRWVRRLILVCLLAFAPGLSAATITVFAEFDPRWLAELEFDMICSLQEIRTTRHEVAAGAALELTVRDLREGFSSCQVLAALPEGYTADYQVSGSSANRADLNGCQFAQLRVTDRNECRISVRQEPVTVTVFKKWIGASGKGADVRVTLDCESGEWSGDRHVNEGAPASWEVRGIDPDGILCNVTEEEREDFRPDIIDCQGLYITPGRGEECTLVNTKIVKRIETLNRYGKVVLILLVLSVGLLAIRRKF